MPFSIKTNITLSNQERVDLQIISRSTSSEYRLVQRAKIILMLSIGCPYSEIREQLQTTDSAISKWKRRYLKMRLDGLSDEKRSGKPTLYNSYDHARVMHLACSKPDGGYSNWSQARIAEKLGMSQSTVSRILSESELKPHKTEYWCGKSTDPEFESKMIDVIGLYMNPPENALVLSVDEKTQIQALDRTQPELPLRSGYPKRLTSTYKRHGTVSLIAALSVHQGQITAEAVENNNSENFLKFLKKLDRRYRNKQLHIIVDNLKVHSNKTVKEWLSHKRKIVIHFTPTYSSWLNQIEIWFGILTKDVLKNAVWKSKKQLVSQLMEYIKSYNKYRAKPFLWTYDPFNLYTDVINE